ncbi:PD40 domain-containing protein [Cyanobacteria bacterium FACHB-472]|nr:PD40 domain-containing protein [Cyanobacteria bacterium FACHB-472]
MQTAQYDLFISYADADSGWVEGYLLDSLKQAGVRYHSEAAFALGTVRLLEFERAIEQSDRTLLVLSPAYLADGFNQFIDLLAQCYGFDLATWPVIPLVLQSVKLPPRLNALVKLNATNPTEWEEATRRLCADLKQPVPALSPKSLCPYPGMVPFSEDNCDRFFGRDAEVKKLIERLRLHPFISVIGPSGNGKSSLVFAGLIPALRRSGLFGSGEWLVRSIRPGETPLTELETALGNDLANPTLAVTQALASQSNAQRLLLVIDQFEEVFTLAQEEAAPFQKALLHLIDTPNCYLILTVRADFYPQLMESLLWRTIQSYRMEVVPLDAVGLREAIIRPAESVGVFIEAALIERLVADAAGEPGALPLIQETLVLLWEKVERRFLPLRAYEALVLTSPAYSNFDGSNRTGLQAAIANRADFALVALSEEERQVARRIFLRLIQFGEGRADTRRQQSVEQLRVSGDDASLFDRTLLYLAEHRLLTLSGGEEDSSRKVDLAHEALISGWPALRWWLIERREAEQTRRRLVRQVEEWVRLGKGSGGLLDEVELAEAERWRESPDAAELGYEETLLTLVEASKRAIQEAKEREEAARQRELDLIRERLEQEEKASEQERKARKAAQTRTNVAITAAGLVSIAAVVALWQWNQAVQGEIKTLTALSKSELSQNNQLEGLIQSVRAGKKLKQPNFLLPNRVRLETVATLAKAVYEVQERDRLEGHSREVRSVSFSPDGSMIATASKDATIRLWSLDEREFPPPLKLDDISVTSVSFSPDSQMIASGNEEGMVTLWNPDGKKLRSFRAHNQNVQINSVSFSPDGQKIASAAAERTIKLWNRKLWNRDGKPLGTLEGHTGEVTSVSFSPNDEMIASASADKTINLWNKEGKLLKTLKGHTDTVKSVSFSPDGQSPDGQSLASASEDGTVRLWNLNNKQELILDDHNGSVNDVSFSPDGQTLASVGEDNTVKLWSKDGILLETLKGHTAPVKSVSFSPDGKTLVSVGDDNTVRIWNLNDNSSFNVLTGHSAPVSSVSSSPKGQTLASVSLDGEVKLWKLPGGEELTLQHTLKGYVVAFSPDGKTIAIASSSKDNPENNTIKLQNLNGQKPKILGDLKDMVTSLSFSSDGKIIASISEGEDKTVITLWNLKGENVRSWDQSDPVSSISFSPNSPMLALGGQDGTLKLWNFKNNELKDLGKHQQRVTSVSFSPDGQMIASASEDSTVKLWNLDGKDPQTLRGHNGWVTSVNFSSDGQMIASASEDKTVKLWSRDGKELATLKGRSYPISGVSFSQDSKMIAAASDNTVILWSLDLDHLLDRGCEWMRLSNYLKTKKEYQDLCR